MRFSSLSGPTFRLRQCHQSMHCSRSIHSRPSRRRRISSNYAPAPESYTGATVPRRAQETPQHHQSYAASDRNELAKKYSPAQLEAIAAGEAAISAQDLTDQGKLRKDPLRFEYLDDFSRIEKTIDKKIEKLRGDGQDYDDVEGHAIIPHENHVFIEAARAEHEAEVEDVGHWVPARPKDPKEREKMYQGPLNKLELRRTPHQIAKAALREYLGTSTVREAIEFCWRKDIEMFEEERARYDGRASETTGSNEATESDFDIDDLPSLRLHDLPLDSDRPVNSRHFDSSILPDPRYKEIFKRVESTPPTPKHFGTPPLDTKLREIFNAPEPDVAPEIPKIKDPTVRWGPSEETSEGSNDRIEGLEDDSLEAYQRLSKSTGESILQLRNYRVKTIVSKRVVNQTRLGKISSIYILCVAGNEKGMVGLGEGKAVEGIQAARMARLNAIRNMVPILRYENRTIYGDISAKVGAVQVKLSARQPGFGLRTSQHVFEIAKCAGLLDLSARVNRSRNPMNIAKAVWEALRNQKDPEDIARARGKKLVDVRRVYYSGLV